MNEIVVGVKPIAGSSIAETDEEAVGAIGAIWVTVDGEELPVAGDKNMIAASVSFGGDGEGGFMNVHLKLFASSFRTVRWDSEEAPERFRT